MRPWHVGPTLKNVDAGTSHADSVQEYLKISSLRMLREVAKILGIDT